MTTTGRQLVIAYDFSQHGRAVLDQAVALAKTPARDVLHFVSVLDPKQGLPAVPPGGPVDFAYVERVRECLTERIADVFQDASIPHEVQFYLHVRIGNAAHEILELAREVGADAIFIGTHGYTGLKHLMMGSVAERVVREAGCPVTVVRAKTYPDVMLEPVVEIPPHKRPVSRRYLFSYTNNQVIMRPPDWTI